MRAIFRASSVAVLVCSGALLGMFGHSTRAGASATRATSSPQPATPAPSNLTVSLSAGTNELNEYRSTDLLLVLTNKGAARIVTRVVLVAPVFARISYQGRSLPAKSGSTTVDVDQLIGQNDQSFMIFGVSVSGPLQPGKSLLAVAVVSHPAAGIGVSTVVASTSITFAVLGESAFLNAVGLPSLLLVPGLVFAVVLWILVRRVYPAKRAAEQSAMSLPGIEEKVVFWVLAIPIGIGLTFAYHPVTALLGIPRDILTAYGLDDILAIWVMSAVAAFAAWALWWIVPLICRRIWRRSFVPQPCDDAIRILGKLRRRAWLPFGPTASLRRPRGVLTQAGQPPLTVCVLSQAHGTSLVSSPVLYGPADSGIATAVTADDVPAVARAIKRAGPAVHVRYTTPSAPVLVDSSAVQVRSGDRLLSIIELDEGESA